MPFGVWLAVTLAKCTALIGLTSRHSLQVVSVNWWKSSEHRQFDELSS